MSAPHLKIIFIDIMARMYNIETRGIYVTNPVRSDVMAKEYRVPLDFELKEGDGLYEEYPSWN